MEASNVEILLVEDNPGDVELTLHAFKENNLTNRLHVVRDGAEALDYLFCTGAYSARNIENGPKLILLDLNLPKVDGLEVLRRIKADPRTRIIPVVVLTTSRQDRDIVESYHLGVNSYIVKPVNFEQFLDAVRQVGLYWLLLNQPRVRYPVPHALEEEQRRIERKKLEEQLQQAQKMEAVARLAGGVAHDFGNLLMAIQGNAYVLLTDCDLPASVREKLQDIKTAGERGAKLTRQLLAFGRKQVIEQEVLDLNAVVTSLEPLCRSIVGENVEFVTRLQENLGCPKADRGQLERVLMNLVINARDAMSEGGQLMIETADVIVEGEEAAKRVQVRPGAYVAVSVTDSGCGMTEETMARMFEPFFTTKQQGKGTGLGLSIVHGIVKQGGGHMVVTSKLLEGSTFTVYFPRTEDPLSPSTPSSVPAQLPRGSETILVADDDREVRNLLGPFLGSLGYSVLTARDGIDALQQCEQHMAPIDLLLADVVMPKMSGPQLAELMAAKVPSLKVLYISGYPDDTMERDSWLENGSAFLEKPCQPDVLAVKVRAVLDAL